MVGPLKKITFFAASFTYFCFFQLQIIHRRMSRKITYVISLKHCVRKDKLKICKPQISTSKYTLYVQEVVPILYSKLIYKTTSWTHSICLFKNIYNYYILCSLGFMVIRPSHYPAEYSRPTSITVSSYLIFLPL